MLTKQRKIEIKGDGPIESENDEERRREARPRVRTVRRLIERDRPGAGSLTLADYVAHGHDSIDNVVAAVRAREQANRDRSPASRRGEEARAQLHHGLITYDVPVCAVLHVTDGTLGNQVVLGRSDHFSTGEAENYARSASAAAPAPQRYLVYDSNDRLVSIWQSGQKIPMFTIAGKRARDRASMSARARRIAAAAHRRPARAAAQDKGGGKWSYSTKEELAERIGMFQAAYDVVNSMGLLGSKRPAREAAMLPPGTRVRLVKPWDQYPGDYPLQPGATGTIRGPGVAWGANVYDVVWDDGLVLGLNPSLDQFEVIEAKRLAKRPVSEKKPDDWTEEEKRALIDKSKSMTITLNGKPASIGGALLRFAQVGQVGGPLQVEYSWDAVQSVLDKDGQFVAEAKRPAKAAYYADITWRDMGSDNWEATLQHLTAKLWFVSTDQWAYAIHDSSGRRVAYGAHFGSLEDAKQSIEADMVMLLVEPEERFEAKRPVAEGTRGPVEGEAVWLSKIGEAMTIQEIDWPNEKIVLAGAGGQQVVPVDSLRYFGSSDIDWMCDAEGGGTETEEGVRRYKIMAGDRELMATPAHSVEQATEIAEGALAKGDRAAYIDWLDEGRVEEAGDPTLEEAFAWTGHLAEGAATGRVDAVQTDPGLLALIETLDREAGEMGTAINRRCGQGGLLDGLTGRRTTK